MKSIILSVVSLGVLGIMGCSYEVPTIPENDLVVVQAYLYANKPVNDIQLTSTISFGSKDSIALPINDAPVVLIKNGQNYELEPSAGDSGYYHYAGTDLLVEVGDMFTIEVSYFDKIAVAETVVPSSPDNVSTSTDTLTIISFEPGDEPLDILEEQGITVNWKNEDESLFFVVYENIESNPQPVNDSDFIEFELEGFISPPFTGESYTIYQFDITHLGKHRVMVYQINQEYADLYETRMQDSRVLNEPITNIQNGLGIFSAFNSDSVFFYAIKE